MNIQEQIQEIMEGKKCVKKVREQSPLPFLLQYCRFDSQVP